MLSPDETLILLLSRASVSDKDLLSLKDRLRDLKETEWPQIIKKIDLSQTAPIAYRNLKDMNYVPEAIVSSLEKRYLVSMRRNVLLMNEIENISKYFREKDLQCIFLKGALASEQMFGDVGLYTGGDIDMLVKPKDLDKAKRCIEELGYKQAGGYSEKDYLETHYHLPPYMKGDYVVEIHWKLTKRYVSIPPDFWWEKTIEYSSNNVSYTLLSPERYLLSAVFRLYSHGFQPLRFLVFVAGLIEHFKKETDWRFIMDSAEIFHMKRITSFSLKLAKEYLDASVPDHLTEKGLFGYDYLKERIDKHLFSGEKRHSRNMMLYILLQDNVMDLVIVGLGRLWPSVSEIRLRYGLPVGSKKVFLYYLLNPFFLLAGRSKIGRNGQGGGSG